MQKQCAGCGKVFDDGSGVPNPAGAGTIQGVCEECNRHTFRTHPQNEVKESAFPVGIGVSHDGPHSGGVLDEVVDAETKPKDEAAEKAHVTAETELHQVWPTVFPDTRVEAEVVVDKEKIQ